ncbi:MAG: carboxylesterase family protein [Caulobacter sp.]|nr:carboxylesterase family protein [Caulobacter sp.]
MRTAVRALVALTVLGCVHVSAASAQPVVAAPAGSVQGETLGDINLYKGIPYALPPTGWRRWRPPVAAPRWTGTRDATQFGPACHQLTGRGASLYAGPVPPMSEDCLSLNIWAPAHAKNAPVLVWIHGGALTNGSSSETMYDGARLAAEGVIVVSINYRLGILGYLAHPELSGESRKNVSGNYGLLDQIAALRWIKQNIPAFGGDPARVTIAGESAGALSVLYLMASPEARGLFSRAVAESAYMLSTPELRSSRYGDPPAEGVGAWLQMKLGRTNLAGLRAMDAQDLTVAAAKAGYVPWGTVDGVILPEQLVEIFDRGQQAPVPLLAGFNQGEIRSLPALAPPAPADAATYERAIRERYGDLADAFLAVYPSSDIAQSVLATPRDALYGWTAERLARRQTAIGQPAFLYLFDHGYPAADGAGLHAFHASEIPYVFGTRDRTPPNWPAIPDTATETGLSDAMRAYWTSFARDGTPSALGQPAWSAYGQSRAYMAFEEGPVARERLMPGMFKLHETVVCRRRVTGKTPWNWKVGIVSIPVPPATPACS